MSLMKWISPAIATMAIVVFFFDIQMATWTMACAIYTREIE